MTNDPKDLIKQYYSPPVKQPQIITIPPMNFLMINGHGDPNNDPSYPLAISALYTLSYTLKFDLKKAGTPEYKVFPLQGLWWAENMDAFRDRREIRLGLDDDDRPAGLGYSGTYRAGPGESRRQSGAKPRWKKSVSKHITKASSSR